MSSEKRIACHPLLLAVGALLLAGCATPSTPPEPPGSLTTALWKTRAFGSSAPAELFTIEEPQAVLDLATQVWDAGFPDAAGTPDEFGEINNRWPSSECWFFDPESAGEDHAGSPADTDAGVWPDVDALVYCGPTQLLDVDDGPGDGWAADLDHIDLARITTISGNRLVVRDKPVDRNDAAWGDPWMGPPPLSGPEPHYRFFRPDGRETTWAELLERSAGERPEVDPNTIPISAPAFWREAVELSREVVALAGLGLDVAGDLPAPADPDVVAAVDRLAAAITAFEKADDAWAEAWDGRDDSETSHDGLIDVVVLVEEVAEAYRPVAEKVDVSNSLTEHMDAVTARLAALRSRAGLTEEMVHALDLMESLNEQVRAAELRWREAE